MLAGSKPTFRSSIYRLRNRGPSAMSRLLPHLRQSCADMGSVPLGYWNSRETSSQPGPDFGSTQTLCLSLHFLPAIHSIRVTGKSPVAKYTCMIMGYGLSLFPQNNKEPIVLYSLHATTLEFTISSSIYFSLPSHR